MKAEQPIFITGCARSGTSMTGAFVLFCGAFGGEMSGPTRYNKKGMYENHRIRETVIKPYLERMCVDPKGQYPLPDINNLLPFPDIKRRFLRILVEEGFKDDDNTRWFYKGAKMCLFWPVLHKAFPNAQWIIVRRDTEDIIHSCLKTPFMNQRHTEDSWREWVEHHLECFEEMKSSGLEVREVWPTKFVEGYFSELHGIAEWLGYEFTSDLKEKMSAFVCPDWWTWNGLKENSNGK